MAHFLRRKTRFNRRDMTCIWKMRCVTPWALEVKITLHSESLSHPISIDPTFNMGQYEVTPVVYEQLFLRTKRYGQNLVFLGPTMLHHKKNFDTYKVLASTCVSSCKGLTAAKGFITDGEEEPFRGWKKELPKATHLRCIRHFQSNCREKLRETGIREAKSQ